MEQHNTANEDIAKLQRVQNCLARVVTRSPVHYRIIFKICITAYQALLSTQPAYLNSMLVW